MKQNSIVRSVFTCWFVFIISQTVAGQNLTPFKVPQNYKLVTQATGDLDRDGIAETVYVFDSDKPDGNVGFKRILYICKQSGKGLKLWKTNSSILRSNKDCGFCIDAGVNLSIRIKNNTLITEQTFNHNSRHFSTWKNIYRYQNNDWFLIGSTYHDYDTCYFDYQYDINFSTSQVNVSYTYGDCDEERTIPKDTSHSFKYPFKEILKMDGFIPGMKELPIPETSKKFYY